MMEDDEVMLEFGERNKDDKESNLFTFLKNVIIENALKELIIPEEEKRGNHHETTYGFCKTPFGILRMRIVEFLGQVFQVFAKEVFPIFMEYNVFDTLSFFFEHYPFHNILHAKVSEIIILVLEKCYDEQLASFLEKTDWVRKILDISKENSVYKFETGAEMSKGYMAFIRKISNKLVET
jgi:hypothetical protein